MRYYNLLIKAFLTLAIIYSPTISAQKATVSAQTEVAQWEQFAQSFTCKTSGNPFTDVELSAEFIHESTNDTLQICGFYDGNDTFRLRFMPTQQGKWRFITHSNIAEMNAKRGVLLCTKPKSDCHGMVIAAEDHAFRYADGTFYHPFGTTSYAWTHASAYRQEETYASLAASGFNKLRFCVFPNNSVNDEPSLYPFRLIRTETDSVGKRHYVWDYNSFNPAFFQHLERSISRLQSMQIEADLILFSPYDEGRWGFDRMPMEANMRYLKYVVSRLSSYRNIWWSMANEWDLVKKKTLQQWKDMSCYVSEQDPYHHLLSIHGGTATYIDYNLPYFTHVSVQDQGPLYNFEGAATVRNIFPKPIIFDEVCYEGDHESRWAQLTGQEMLQRIWTGLIGGTYVTHGECFCSEPNFYTGYAFLATGGQFKGTSASRIKFTRDIIESLPSPPRLADRSWDPATAAAGEGIYLIYFGDKTQREWAFSLPAKCDKWKRTAEGDRFKVDIIDTWNMTITPCDTIFEVQAAAAKRMVDKQKRSVLLPNKPYILLKISRIQGE